MNSVDKYPEDKFLDRYVTEEGEREVIWNFDYHKKYTFTSLWMLFFTFSVGGWLWEVAYHWFSRGELVNRGALHGPWVPIYGTGAVLIAALLWRWVDRPLRVFVSIIVISAVVEYSTSYVLEKMKGIRFWDYSKDFMNLNGRIYMEGLIFFGLGGCIVLYLLAPMLEELYKKIADKVKWFLLLVLTILFLIDVIYSFDNPNKGNGVTYVKQTKHTIEIKEQVPI